MILIEVMLILLGTWLIVATLLSAVRSFVVPRSERVRLTSLVFRLILRLFELRLKRTEEYASRDRFMAIFAPLTLLIMPFVWQDHRALPPGVSYAGAEHPSPRVEFLADVTYTDENGS